MKEIWPEFHMLSAFKRLLLYFVVAYLHYYLRWLRSKNVHHESVSCICIM